VGILDVPQKRIKTTCARDSAEVVAVSVGSRGDCCVDGILDSAPRRFKAAALSALSLATSQPGSSDAARPTGYPSSPQPRPRLAMQRRPAFAAGPPLLAPSTRTHALTPSAFISVRPTGGPVPRRSPRPPAPAMVARPENEPDAAVSASVESLYDRFPYPPETILDEAPIGYNWRWHYPTAYAFCTGHTPAPATDMRKPLRILDAGCGTGESTSYLVHMNPGAEVVAIDLSNEALSVAKERLQRAIPDQVSRATFVHKSIFDVAELPGQFDLINSVGVIHHTPDPLRALRALADKLAPGGLMHIFVYAAHGRWEIQLMQEALRLLQRGKTDFDEGVRLGRAVFDALPDGNRLKVRESSRWAADNLKDATFADMYCHTCEVDYDVKTLFEMIDASGLDFVGMSNPRTWDLARVLGKNAELLENAQGLSEREQYRLVELLDPESATHFEFFLSKPPLAKSDWADDEALRKAEAALGTCINGWPGMWVMDRDYFPVGLSDDDYSFLTAVAESPGSPVGAAVDKSNISLDAVRRLAVKQLILLTRADDRGTV
jgi:SAM-dependent methyltransferase